MNENDIRVHPGAVALAKVIIGLGVAGLILWLMPWSVDVLFWGFVLPLLVVAAIAASLGFTGSGLIEFYNATIGAGQMAAFKAALREALVQEQARA